MTIYLVIITTVLVITQIFRLVQNALQLRRQTQMIKRQLDGLDDITQLDILNQRKMHRLVIKYLEDAAQTAEGE